jgi:hypothetical protein
VREEAIEEAADIQKVRTTETDRSTTAHEQGDGRSKKDPEYKARGLFNSVGRLIVEQRGRWVLYTFVSLGILVAGAIYPIHAWIFANVIEVFTFTGQRFVDEGNFWSAMFGVEAAAVGIAYFVLGFCAHQIAVVSAPRIIRESFPLTRYDPLICSRARQ